MSFSDVLLRKKTNVQFEMRPNYAKPNTQTLLFSESFNARQTERESFLCHPCFHVGKSLLNLDSENFADKSHYPTSLNSNSNSNSKFK
jgi:hypothetical protein